MKTYDAPWSTSLLVSSSAFTLICVGIAVAIVWSAHGFTLIAWGPLAIIFAAALFSIRGYAVTPDAILVHRLFWKTRVPLAGLQSVQFEPDATLGGIRRFGNGGLFSFSGFFWNKTLGVYRAFVTDARRAVVLRFPDRTTVVSPSAPEDFVRELYSMSYR